ncbi:30S ribosomal protein S20 [bacterium]|nr:30S ribosomal protein S20 [bacterium]
MPITKSAKKALRRSQRRRKINKIRKEKVKATIKAFKKSLTAEALKKAYSAIDRAAQKRVFHKNKARRLKSQLAKLFQKHQSSQAKKPAKKATRKKPAMKKKTEKKK